MCGFVGFIDSSNTGSSDALRQTVTAMSDQIRHRGPDDGGAWIDPQNHMALGFRRLAIIDITQAGNQPLYSSDDRFAMVFNGEIYNYIELREQLIADGVKIETKSDSVVLFSALQNWGIEKTLSLINGMFAIAFWDGHKNQLYLMRDRLGQKPLYYFFNGQTLLFGSELKCFLKYPAFRKTINPNAVAAFMKYAYVPEPLSIYKDTFKVKPGEYLVYSTKNKALKNYQYWSLEDVVHSKVSHEKKEVLVQQVHGALRNSVKLRMRSDVPFGSFLSGGIDSSLITALMQEQSSDKVRTFSIGFHESQFNESPYAKKVAEHLGTDHTELYVTSKQAQEVIPNLAHIYDEPFADPSQIPTFLVSKLTRDYVTVALSGDGGDESFAGYNRHFWVPNMWRYMGKQPALIKKMMRMGIQMFRPPQWNKLSGLMRGVTPKRFQYQNVGDKLYKLIPFLSSAQAIDVYDKLSSFWHEPEEILSSANGFSPAYADMDLNLVHEMMYRDTKYYLPGDILTKVDRASMAVSLEVRSPFLDHTVIEEAWKLPLDMKLKNSHGKLILKQLLAEYVPRKLFERPKMGFGVPICDWLRGPLREWADDLLSESKLRQDDIFEPQLIQKYWREHLSGQRNWQYPLWCVLMFQSWSDCYNV
jgi:asparagine synthase (glutamine-hydrolysing)